jgi:glycosyltransferase involved in cell wall biosynthesis
MIFAPRLPAAVAGMHCHEILEGDILPRAAVVRSMKILIISTLYPPHVIGGAEKAAAELAEALVRHGHVVVVVSLHPESNEVVENRNGVRVFRLPLDNFYWPFGRKGKPSVLRRLAWHIREMWNPMAARRIGKILDAEIPDVVNTHNVCGFSLAAWQEVKRRKLRLVHTLHDYYLMCPRCTLFDKGRNCEKRCLSCKLLTFNRRRLSRLPDSIVSVSRHALREHVTRHYLEDLPAAVIYNIQRSLQSLPPQALQGEQLSADLVFGFIGRVEEEKGIETLLAATRQLRSSNWKLKIAGKGIDGYVDKLKRTFTDSRIEWLGFTDAVRFYSSVDVVILPSLWAEPLPYVCVESLHAGKSLICASSGGIPEIARLSEIVEFFPAGNADALAAKMNLALTSPQKWRERKALDESRLTSFREEYVVDRYLREYASQKQELSTSNVQ